MEQWLGHRETLQATSLQMIRIVGPVFGIVLDILANGIERDVGPNNVVVIARLPCELREAGQVTFAGYTRFVGPYDGGQ